MNRNWEKRQNRKNMFLAGAKSAILTAAVIPVLGLAVHGLNELGTVRVENYSVKNRFECAYCFNVPESNKYYYYQKPDCLYETAYTSSYHPRKNSYNNFLFLDVNAHVQRHLFHLCLILI